MKLNDYRSKIRSSCWMKLIKSGKTSEAIPRRSCWRFWIPSRNRNFVDHYLDVLFDLSAVMFIATANVTDNLPTPLLDRLEVINFHGYTEKEKMQIAKDFLVPRQLRDNRLTGRGIDFTEDSVSKIIRDYTSEAGLRNLEREIANIARKLARMSLKEGQGDCPALVTANLVETFLGPRKFTHEVAEAGNQIGVTTGLVRTEFGGEIISVEAARMKGNQQLILTGSLGDVLRESAQTALSYVRSNAERLGIDPDFFSGTISTSTFRPAPSRRKVLPPA